MKSIKFLTLVFGLLYLFYGLIELLAFFGIEIKTLIYPQRDIYVSFVLLVISSIYLAGLKNSILGKERKAISYLYVASLLSIAAGVLGLMVIGANALETYILKNEDFANWTLYQGLSSYFILGLISVIAFWKAKKIAASKKAYS
ncbi:conserved hypothetical protein [Methanothermus fervidus DSM 2088]|uniref:Uncharacterized protein n=1 Tax=Methanothermus fervidus (strain ATCC 43054 / DSM 2088 / JCM 10308 / V24 S) TaxID=523846 RepID=E3GW20_METFV|nr:hypothetical protein [Methanothermus fervidus]ADP77785.1 conserved hypothetical protein [Methanothermus fervidus DSM 2088]